MTDQQRKTEFVEALDFFRKAGGGFKALSAMNRAGYLSAHAVWCLQAEGYFPTVPSAPSTASRSLIRLFTEEARILHLEVRANPEKYPELAAKLKNITDADSRMSIIGSYVRNQLAPQQGIKNVVQDYIWENFHPLGYL